jgi:alpha-D-ribose 1-methylphosphonate 5-triphosphate diphosphatase
MTKKIYYEKRGRRYYPVMEHDYELMDAMPRGNHLIMCYPGGRSTRYNIDPALAPMIAAMDQAGSEGLLRAEHLLHLRCEITNPELLSLVEPHLDNPRLKLLSVMDHTPGQRQTADLNRFKDRLEKAGTAKEEVASMLATETNWRDPSAGPKNRETILKN